MITLAYGFIYINKLQNGDLSIRECKYRSIISMQKNNESTTWKKLKQEFNKFNDWPILH